MNEEMKVGIKKMKMGEITKTPEMVKLAVVEPISGGGEEKGLGWVGGRGYGRTTWNDTQAA